MGPDCVHWELVEQLRGHAWRSDARLRIDPRVLVLAESSFTPMGHEIVHILEANRIKYKLELAGKSLPVLTHLDKGRYAVIVFERLESYLNMDKWNRELIDKYCREYKVGILTFTHPEDALIKAQVRGFPLYVHTKLSLRDYHVNAQSAILRLTRAGNVVHGPLPDKDWTVFVLNHTTYEPLSYAKLHLTGSPVDPSVQDAGDINYVTAVLDKGLFDDIQRVIFGNGFKFWLHRLLFLDALSYLSHGKLSITLERYLLIDIDDIFVGKNGTRMVPSDVQALIDAQARIRRTVKDFHFNLGYSGYYYKAGVGAEDDGDEAIIANARHFWWFPHMWRHLQPHKFDNLTLLELDMLRNKQFAQNHGLVLNQSYAVAPHHSGVFPVHEQLYTAWKRVFDVQVTSTEEYPHLRSPHRRRGFVHRNIRVLPRQTCGLFTHTIFLERYPGGRGKLDYSIRGGELFQTFLYNPINIFMTHLSNYGNDRLALYTFESVIKFVQCWTNLEIKTVPPVELANVYFDMFPEEVSPIWRNPCDDKRHLSIWSVAKTCSRLPKFLVIGPQKTGTTALYSFLGLHPSIRSNANSPTTYEEVQFFNGKNYFRGLDWYMDFFPPVDNSSDTVLFEKSANYFDSDVAPERAHALLPHVKLLCILINPAKRAYSWYQHMIAHQDAVAMSNTFYQVITADENASKAVRDLKHRCLNPGMYASLLERWLDYYPPKQIMIIDGEKLRSDPVSVMDRVQAFLGLEIYFDYSKKLKFSKKKGFYCQVLDNNKTKCLGASKGHQYVPMEPKEEEYLRKLYRKDNIALSKLLPRLGRSIPSWLQEELADLR
ncbi:hypothetical protein CAPTEDRAFT_225180 [Capitella teleta]|uniref:[heparan sulfate]-glucosamine N-sulfotransferase n=1 Tax=Capitella teleta TaxID=283909 RepID=R7VE08_CAPTE|nr:hypothetical protein CAPTEDRAFT_225180 [Capitella teleta]|eukprot:ELU16792.1 hypothetical protein CAPTEDRAFT_225180 [Capitella teleta]